MRTTRTAHDLAVRNRRAAEYLLMSRTRKNQRAAWRTWCFCVVWLTGLVSVQVFGGIP